MQELEDIVAPNPTLLSASAPIAFIRDPKNCRNYNVSPRM